MTKEELISDIAKKSDLKESEVANIIKIFVEEIKRKLDKGEKVEIPGFGNFSVGK